MNEISHGPGLVTVTDGPDNGAMRLFAAAGALLLTLSAAPSRPPRPGAVPAVDEHPGHGWQLLEPGLEVGLFDGPAAEDDGRPIAIVRIDPARFELRLLNASAPGEGTLRTARAWAGRAGAVAAINASMYQEDYRTSVSLMRTRAHVNQRRVSKDRSVLAFDPVARGAPVRIIDRDCEDLESAAKGYGTLVQSIRLVSCDRKNVWAPSDRRFSTAAIGVDGSGRILFIHARTPWPVHELVNALLALPIDLRRAMYVEGGPEAQLFVRGGGREHEWVGGFERPAGREPRRVAGAERRRGRAAAVTLPGVRELPPHPDGSGARSPPGSPSGALSGRDRAGASSEHARPPPYVPRMRVTGWLLLPSRSSSPAATATRAGARRAGARAGRALGALELLPLRARRARARGRARRGWDHHVGRAVVRAAPRRVGGRPRDVRRGGRWTRENLQIREDRLLAWKWKDRVRIRTPRPTRTRTPRSRSCSPRAGSARRATSRSAAHPRRRVGARGDPGRRPVPADGRNWAARERYPTIHVAYLAPYAYQVFAEVDPLTRGRSSCAGATRSSASSISTREWCCRPSGSGSTRGRVRSCSRSPAQAPRPRCSVTTPCRSSGASRSTRAGSDGAARRICARACSRSRARRSGPRGGSASATRRAAARSRSSTGSRTWLRSRRSQRWRIRRSRRGCAGRSSTRCSSARSRARRPRTICTTGSGSDARSSSASRAATTSRSRSCSGSTGARSGSASRSSRCSPRSRSCRSRGASRGRARRCSLALAVSARYLGWRARETRTSSSRSGRRSACPCSPPRSTPSRPSCSSRCRWASPGAARAALPARAGRGGPLGRRLRADLLRVARDPRQDARRLHGDALPRKTVHVCDDSHREAVARLAAEHGARYIAGPKRHAKAGNLNNALSLTQGDLVVVFDTDHVPSAAFLERTVPHFREPRMGVVQTPHHFHNPDVFQRAFGTGPAVPNEADLFNHAIQAGRDAGAARSSSARARCSGARPSPRWAASTCSPSPRTSTRARSSTRRAGARRSWTRTSPRVSPPRTAELPRPAAPLDARVPADLLQGQPAPRARAPAAPPRRLLRLALVLLLPARARRVLRDAALVPALPPAPRSSPTCRSCSPTSSRICCSRRSPRTRSCPAGRGSCGERSTRPRSRSRSRARRSTSSCRRASASR